MGYFRDNIEQMAGYEADDLIGTIAKNYEKKVDKVLIVTGDMDTLQLVDDKINVIWRDENKLSDEYTVEYDLNNDYANLIDKIKDRILLVIDVDEGEEVVVRQIVFHGNKAFDDGDLRGAMDDIFFIDGIGR